MVNTKLDFNSAYQPQTDGQIEVVSRSLGDLLRCLMGDHVKSWDQKLCQAEFAHNHAINQSSRFSPFQGVYSMIPHGPLDLIPLPSKIRAHGKAAEFVDGLQAIHKEVHDHLVQAATKYKMLADKKRHHVGFEVGDFVLDGPN
ncbi:hypothetical protein AAC387_Pa03g1787 [Persea americana]